MKKLIAILCCLLMLFSFVACDGEHTHAFSAEWANDTTHHWHGCKFPCPETSDKAEHTWDDGTVVKEPTKDEDGEMKYACTVCGAKKNEVLVFNGVDEKTWAEMISAETFENYTLVEKMFVVEEGETDVTVKFTKDKVSFKMHSSDEPILMEGEEAKMQKGTYEQVYLALLADYENFVYDAERDLFVNNGTVTVEIDMLLYDVSAVIVMKNAEIVLTDDYKIASFACEFTQTTTTPRGTHTITVDSIWTFSDYGTTVID